MLLLIVFWWFICVNGGFVCYDGAVTVLFCYFSLRLGLICVCGLRVWLVVFVICWFFVCVCCGCVVYVLVVKWILWVCVRVHVFSFLFVCLVCCFVGYLVVGLICFVLLGFGVVNSCDSVVHRMSFLFLLLCADLIVYWLWCFLVCLFCLL